MLCLDPFILIPQQVDKGAIRFVLSGANIMSPGLTSKGGKLVKCNKDKIVAIMAEGKQHALAIGITKMSTDDMLVIFSIFLQFYLNFLIIFFSIKNRTTINKGIAIEVLHYLNDGLFQMKNIK
jgi:malignant T-cell-amplified sequence